VQTLLTIQQSQLVTVGRNQICSISLEYDQKCAEKYARKVCMLGYPSSDGFYALVSHIMSRVRNLICI